MTLLSLQRLHATFTHDENDTKLFKKLLKLSKVIKYKGTGFHVTQCKEIVSHTVV